MSQATEGFKQRIRDAFDEIEVGRVFTFTRTFTEGDVAMFCGVTGDFNPYHIDDSFANESFFGGRIVPGLLTASMLTHIGGMLGWLATEMHFEFLQPVYIGDTVRCAITVVEKDTERRLCTCDAVCVNAQGAEVVRARFGGFPGLVRLAR